MYKLTIFKEPKVPTRHVLTFDAIDCYKAQLSTTNQAVLRESLVQFVEGDKSQLNCSVLKWFLNKIGLDANLDLSKIDKPIIRDALEKVLLRLETCVVPIPLAPR